MHPLIFSVVTNGSDPSGRFTSLQKWLTTLLFSPFGRGAQHARGPRVAWKTNYVRWLRPPFGHTSFLEKTTRTVFGLSCRSLGRPRTSVWWLRALRDRVGPGWTLNKPKRTLLIEWLASGLRGSLLGVLQRVTCQRPEYAYRLARLSPI